MSRWTHLSCDDCWREMNGDRVPTRVIDAPEEPCCFCSEPTKSGIYTRHDPKELACEGTRGPVHEDEG